MNSHSDTPGRRLVVPFKGMKFVSVHFGEGVVDVSAEAGVDVPREVLPYPRAVLRPVGVVAHDSWTATACSGGEIGKF